MKKLIVAALAVLFAIPALAQSYCVKVSADIPAEAASVLQKRFEQILRSGGLFVSPEGRTIEISADVKETAVTSGTIEQTAVVVDIIATADGSAPYIFPVKGVGADYADAWQRAVKQILPASKAAKEFLSKI